MMHSIPRFLSIVSLALLAGCSSLNPFSSKGPKPAELPAFEARADVHQLWRVNIAAAETYRFQPAVADGAVYVAGERGELARIDAKSGNVAWSTRLDRLSAGVGANDSLVAVVTRDGELVVLEASSGAERWRTPVGAEVLAAPGVTNDVILVRTSSNVVKAYETSDGSQRWVYQRDMPALTLRNASGMYVEEGGAIIGYPGGKLVGLNLGNGGPMWELTVTTPRGVTELERVADLAGAPVMEGSEVCAVAFQGRAGCFDLANGRVLWSIEFSSSVGLDRSGRLVVVTAADDSVQALDASDGFVLWRQEPMALRRLSRPLVVGGGVVVGDLEGYVHVLDARDGSIVGRGRAGSGAIEAAPVALGDGSFVVQTVNGDVYAFQLRAMEGMQ
ncbi:MAG TPA: outer membrane protein assembly factor BamB [Azoarcus sp.]|nr:outer membrane protein assembly factor BamB [Azoarcus sp.]